MSYPDFKRLMDIFLSITLGAFFSPFCLITALAIKLESPEGPIFADQPLRAGKEGKLFRHLKFRSMIPNAHLLMQTDPKFKSLYEEYKSNSYKVRNDPRITKVGKFIRKYSIDEVPQFINVLKGEMSIIGPRPYFPDELEEQQRKYPYTKEYVKDTLTVRPGITGQWQVTGRSEINFDKRIELDAKYAKIISNSFIKALWYDLKILFKTPFAMLSAKGAV
ncbi:hypothetical protein A3D85_02415 [Candidatus Amesbacteria bacterium RIFCSPHIGHO2_02_FULL_47_9]|uniref:Bacterial sugar transferase domain-containing protein n=1 Tax=Candidatus Amesbacteria bacterium RIFCSPHIGHO2_01_FULL_48_32b TaxID=1797253 RepID=A0A1F4YFD8_9BACT|nr:MAG: hypothetical protein A2876_03405 [Candidatus Amesbacteria bacterium RIFCSPHIGHO2_01_FULL_48_32b]OGD02321.1 MAG: hypothetical protein A3D85_02415 [Candidatus Amesbacteria bacterium RIFCSPHIGHO2_02_FULL_47_9]OGD08498.1 MAG: hypothetical protein A2899_01745 [Candidatus Amesbacteria bacterium RIFCSPLOWO2_01_FULL_49_25]